MANKPAIGVYVPHFLSISMTFIHRQLLGQSDRFEPLVFTARTENRDVFPFSHPVYCRPRTWPERAFCRATKRVTGQHSMLTPSQTFLWKRLLRRHQAGLIHAHFGPAGLEMLPVARALGLPLLVSFHGVDATMALASASYLRSLRDLFAYAHVIAISQVMAERLISWGADPARVEIYHCGVPLDDFRYVERVPVRDKVAKGDQLELLQVSNFVEKKGHCQTVAAFAELLRDYPRCRLTFIGDGPLRGAVESQAGELGIGERVRFLGKQPKEQVIPRLEEADIFLHHSVTAADGDQEGVPTSIMDAMATGLPVVATYHSGIPEIITDRHDGLLVPERDVAVYAQALRSLLGDDGTLGQRAFARAREEFDLVRQSARLCDICQKVMHAHPN
ncbi:MAG: glycosyltransferase [Desulfuromonadales bacterium]|nr:glycosyltransferase [Desulfuromonadales bacterium]